MTKQKELIEKQPVVDSGNVRGSIVKNHILTAEETGGRTRMFARIDIEPGAMIKEHAHVEDAEVYYVLEGELTVTDDEAVRILHPGDVVFTADGHRHSIENRTAEKAAFLAVIL